MNNDYNVNLYQVENEFSNDAEGTEYLLESIEGEFEEPDDIDWSIGAIAEYAKRQYNSDNPNEAKINELFTRWVNRVADSPEEIKEQKEKAKKLIDIIKKEFNNCDESNYASEISQIKDNKIGVNTKDKLFNEEIKKIVKESIKKALKKDGRFESQRYLLAKHDILSMEDDVPMLEENDEGFALTCPDGEDYYDYCEPTITYEELAKSILDKIRNKYPNEVQITFDDVKDILEDMYKKYEEFRYSHYRTTSFDYDIECFEAYESMDSTEQTKMVINALIEKYNNEPKVVEHLRSTLSKVSNDDKEFVDSFSFTMKKEDIDKYLHDVLLYYVENINIDLDGLSLDCYEEEVMNSEGKFESSDFINYLPKYFIEKMDMAYDHYDPEGKPNQYADALAELITKYCINSRGEKYNIEDVKRSFVRSFLKRSSSTLSKLSKELENDDNKNSSKR